MPGQRNKGSNEPSDKTPIGKFRKVFPKLEKPSESLPTMPKTITHMSSEKLGDIHAHYSAWREYTEDLLNDSMAELLTKQEVYDYERDKKYLLISGKNNTERDAKINTDERLRELSVPLSEADLYHELLLKKLESFNNCLATISREISRRGNLAYAK